MNKFLSYGVFAFTVLLSSCDSQPKQEPLADVIDRGLKASTEQALLMAKELENQEGRLPKTINKEGTLETSDYSWWCSGFFPGELWYLYENDPTPELKKYAEMYTDRVEEVKNITYSHDVGFMLNCSYGNGYRLTGKPKYKEVMLTGANSLATRFDERVGAIRSWDFNKDIWQFPVIIDNMMNLEFFSWASKASGDDRFLKMAVSHADKTMNNHFRDDYSCYHVVSYDTITGVPHKKQTHQGYADESAWARGQSWALYGFTMMARETGKPEYLNQAKHIAAFLMNHPNMPADKVPYWDFDAPGIPNVPRDASAAAIMASALVELSQLDKSEDAQSYRDFAEQQVRSLTGPEYLAARGEDCSFALMHSTGHLPGDSEVDVPLTYADYYYVEALMRLKKLNGK
ncbi:MAG: glycoside hydrolase family 88 protein [Parabacteroides sp.]|nr:glycoside hydrolase family 88 protein [Parabacteroides sp.]